MKNDLKDDFIHIENQTVASIVGYMNSLRVEKYNADIIKIGLEESIRINDSDINYAKAINIYETTRARLHEPSSILGSIKTKHGEIAEFLDVAKINADSQIRNAFDWARCDTEAVPRTGPWDYIVNDTKVQSKFGNGENNTLRMVLEHGDKYKNIGYARNDGSIYTIPKDQYENIVNLREAEKLAVTNLNDQSVRTKEAIMRKVDQVENEFSKPFNDVVKPSAFDYDEVQLNRVDGTIDKQEEQLRQIHEEQVREIKDKSEEMRQTAAEEAKPSFGEALEVGAVAAGFSFGMTCCIKAWEKHKEGKKFYKFNSKDWNDIGIATAKGGVSGVTIYSMTNYLNMSAPVAAGFVSAGMGVASLVYDYKKGKIDKDQFIDAAECVCFQSSAATLGAIVGQALIPIPVLGSLIGSITANILSSLGLKYFSKSERKLFEKYKKRMEALLKRCASEYEALVEKVEMKLKEFDDMLDLCFDKELNSIQQLTASVNFAKHVGVADDEIIVSPEQAADYLLS